MSHYLVTCPMEKYFCCILATEPHELIYSPPDSHVTISVVYLEVVVVPVLMSLSIEFTKERYQLLLSGQIG